MKETLIKFETAKLAKGKGFDLWCPSFYATEEFTNYDEDFARTFKKGTAYTYSFMFDEELEKILNAPSQSLLQKWLREEHNIHIQIIVAPISGLVDYYFLIRFGENIGGIESSNDQLTHDNYESALEEALMQSLKLIK